MVAFWKDVATKASRISHWTLGSSFLQAPHHSRASWMKFWRRHKHELNRTDTDEPLPQRPEKKMRYSHLDDILLAKYFCNKPEGTSDKVFQAFGRLVRDHQALSVHSSSCCFSIHIIHGKDGKNIIAFIR